MLLLLWPISLVIAIAIKLEEGWGAPVIFRQPRVGRQGQEFHIMKFLTMRKIEAPSITGDGDIRVTRVGRFLRQLHLDELPVIVNVLRGEMSLVGPWPVHPDVANRIKEEIPSYDKRHAVRPGITGLTQLRHSMGTTAKDLSCDLFFIRNLSFTLSVRILIWTVVVVLFNKTPKSVRGAYSDND